MDAISKHEISLEATNSANMSSIVLITVVVQHPQQDRKINFEISLHLRPKNSEQRITTRLQLELLNLISALYGDPSTNLIMLRHISCDPLVLTWTNTSLSLETCDNTTIQNLLKVRFNIMKSDVRSLILMTVKLSLELERRGIKVKWSFRFW